MGRDKAARASQIECPMRDLVVIGGGAAGFFGAIRAAEECQDLGLPALKILLLEQGSQILSKVKISGGGRCNVTHSCFEPKQLVKAYPRGEKTLIGPFHKWQPRDMIDWLSHRGVETKTERDGRMFPLSNSSQTIIDCLSQAAKDLGIEVRTRSAVRNIEQVEASEERNKGFVLTLGDRDRSTLKTHKVLMACGGLRGAGGGKAGEVLRNLGHTVTETVPSLFTFHIDHPLLKDLPGIAVKDAEVSATGATGSRLTQRGPVLITHWGVSGPAILKLSAWGARELATKDYTFELKIDWLAPLTDKTQKGMSGAECFLKEQREQNASRYISKSPPRNEHVDIPNRLWQRMLEIAKIDPKQSWSHLKKEQQNQLRDLLSDCLLPVSGKSLNKDEFVTCGGVSVKEVDFRTMESRIVPSLYFAGEVLDIDGITGGYNFQNAWTTGHLAGRGIIGR